LPLYDFKCEACQLRFDALKGIDDRHSAECPRCGQRSRKLMSVANHTFGWRLTEDSHLPTKNLYKRKQDEWEKNV